MDSAVADPSVRRAEAFAADVRAVTVERVRLAGVVGAVSVPMFYFLDVLLSPTLAGTFLQWRLLCSLTCLMCVLCTYRAWGRAHIVALGYTACLAVSTPIAGMVIRIDPGVSTYYAGLNLCLLTIAVLFPWHPRHTFVVSVLIVAEFVLPVIVVGALDRPAFVSNLFFVVTTAAIGTLSSVANFQEYVRRFDLSWSLEVHSRNLADANERLKQADELRNRFFANVSHELRTPLTLALSPLEALRSDPSVPASLAPTLRALHLDMLALGRRIEDLVDLARLDSRRMHLVRAPVDLGLLVDQVATVARPYATRHDLELVVEIAPGTVAMGDLNRLEQVVFNLLSNALKFTPPGGRVRVAVARVDPTRVRLEIEDTGPGMTDEQREELFERFGRTTETTVARGSGLGLALVKEFVDLHAGQIDVLTAPGQGCTFRVDLPAAADDLVALVPSTRREQLMLEFEADLPARATPTPTMLPEMASRPLVLVVDDNRRLRQFVAQTLASEFRVAEAADGNEALALLAEEVPAVVVSDVMMPGLDGRALLASIRREPRTRWVPVVLLTAHGDNEARDEALEEGASDYLAKPFAVRELRARVRNLVALRQVQTELQSTATALEQALEETRAAQGRALRAEKLAAIGQLASGIAHEVKNPINYVVNFARPSRARLERLEARLATHDGLDPERRELAQVREALVRVVEGSERVVGIVDGLQAFARGGGARVPVDLDTEARGALRLLTASLPDAVDVEVDLDARGTVLGSPMGASSILVNLVSNALRAVGDRGRVRVRTRSDATSVMLDVQDDGPGVAPDVRPRIWDPFFTTRGAGEGLGLGLALVQRIVIDDFGGSIELILPEAPTANDPNRLPGAWFRVVLPRAGASGASSAWADLAGPSGSGRGTAQGAHQGTVSDANQDGEGFPNR